MRKIIVTIPLVLSLMACGDQAQDFDATGTFEATEVTVSAQLAGKLKSFTVSEGDNVKANAVLGEIDAYQLQQKSEELVAMKQQLSATETATDAKQLNLQKQVASLEQQVANAQREQQRFAELVKDGAVPRKQLDDISNQVRVLQRQLEATREQIRSNNAALKAQARGIEAQRQGVEAQQRQLADQINNAQIVAPRAGTVLEKYAEAGEFVTPGRPLLKLANVDEMYLRAYVTSLQLKHCRVGQTVTVMADYGEGKQKRTYRGVVAWISSRAEFTPKTILTDDERADLVYAVKIKFKNDGYAKIGMYGEVKFND